MRRNSSSSEFSNTAYTCRFIVDWCFLPQRNCSCVLNICCNWKLYSFSGNRIDHLVSVDVLHKSFVIVAVSVAQRGASYDHGIGSTTWVCRIICVKIVVAKPSAMWLYQLKDCNYNNVPRGQFQRDSIQLFLNRKYINFNENKADIHNKATTDIYNQNHVVNTEK